MRLNGRSPSSHDEQSSSRQLAGLLHIRATPRKAEVAEWGYDWHTARGRRDWFTTCMLCTLLVACAITVSGLTNSMRLIYVQADLCKTRQSTLSANLILMRNITNYYEALQTASTTVNLTATAYYQANETYNSLGTRYEWPAPYDLSEEERQALEIEAREGGDDCETIEECVGGIMGWIGGLVGEKTCVSTEVPCPDIEATALLVEYDASQKSLDLFGNVTVFEYNTSLAQTALDEATEAITELVRRINFASSIYVLYLAFLVVVTPPFIVYGARWKHRVVDVLANVNKPMWIAMIVLIWYAHEFFQSVINSNFYRVIWANFLDDPCWADPEFLTNTSVEISNTCKGITSAQNLFNQASANYRYYEQVENTWWAAIGDVAPDGPFYGDPETELIQTFPGNCSSTVLLEAIQPSDGTVNWWSLFFHSGALVALLLQIVLAHWFIAWFSVLRPLTMNRGRVMIPEASRNDAVLYKEIHDFARARAILPFVITTLVLVFLLVNLGASSSDRDMWRKVLIGSLVLAGFQFVVVPLLIWRPSDERITSTKPSRSPDSPSESIDGLTSDPSFGLRDDNADRSSFRASEHSAYLMPRSLGSSVIGGGVGARAGPASASSPTAEKDAEEWSVVSMLSLLRRMGSSRKGKDKAKITAIQQSPRPDDDFISALEAGETNKEKEGEGQVTDVAVLGELKPPRGTNNKSRSSSFDSSKWCGRLRSSERGLDNQEGQKVEEKGEEQPADVAMLGELKPSRDKNNKSSIGSSIGSSIWRGRSRSTEPVLTNQEGQKVEEKGEEQPADIAVFRKLRPSRDASNNSSSNGIGSSIGSSIWRGRSRSTERTLDSATAAEDKRPTSAEQSLSSALEIAIAAIQGAEAVASASGRSRKSRRK